MTDQLRPYLRAADARPWRYGAHDCAQFAAGWVRLVTGRDLAQGLHYATLRDGLAQLQARGFTDHVAAAAAHLPEVPVAFARRGDLAAIRRPRGLVLGIVLGERVAALSRHHGVQQVPLTEAFRAFRVAA